MCMWDKALTLWLHTGPGLDTKPKSKLPNVTPISVCVIYETMSRLRLALNFRALEMCLPFGNRIKLINTSNAGKAYEPFRLYQQNSNVLLQNNHRTI